MIINQKGFGYSVLADNIGSSWIDSVDSVLQNGVTSFDEGRMRLCLQSFRIKVNSHEYIDDKLVLKYGNQKNIQNILDLTFKDPVMTDIDVNPSFSDGAKSYYARIKEGKMLEFAAKRLSKIPESKKAIIVFPTYEDYTSVLENPWDDYLPCIVSVQFRMVPNGGSGSYKLNTVFYARSMDIYQKGLGNIIAIAHMSEIVIENIKKDTGRNIVLGFIEGFIADVHIYSENITEAQEMVIDSRMNTRLPNVLAV